MQVRLVGFGLSLSYSMAGCRTIARLVGCVARETVEVTCRGVQNHSGINDFAVNDIYTAVVAALTTSPTRTFATEIAVFWSDWWSLANASMRDDA